MNLLDENIIASQRNQLRQWRIPFRQVGHELACPGVKDPEIIPLLRQLKQPTFFTRDYDYFEPRLRHQAAFFIRRFLRHPAFCTHQQRLGTVVRIHPAGLEYWRAAKRNSRGWSGESICELPP